MQRLPQGSVWLVQTPDCRWAIDMDSRIAADPPFAKTNGFGPDFFDLRLAAAAAVLALFTIALLAAVGAVLRRPVRS